MVCRLGLSESGADHMAMGAAAIDFHAVLRQISVSSYNIFMNLDFINTEVLVV